MDNRSSEHLFQKLNTPVGAVYNDEPVWVKSIDLNSKTATILNTSFGEPEKKVLCDQLTPLKFF